MTILSEQDIKSVAGLRGTAPRDRGLAYRCPDVCGRYLKGAAMAWDTGSVDAAREKLDAVQVPGDELPAQPETTDGLTLGVARSPSSLGGFGFGLPSSIRPEYVPVLPSSTVANDLAPVSSGRGFLAAPEDFGARVPPICVLLRIEGFLADVLALEGEKPDAIRQGVRIVLTDCESI